MSEVISTQASSSKCQQPVSHERRIFKELFYCLLQSSWAFLHNEHPQASHRETESQPRSESYYALISQQKNIWNVHYDKDTMLDISQPFNHQGLGNWWCWNILYLVIYVKTKRMRPIELFHQVLGQLSTTHDIQLLAIWVSQKLF